MRNIFKEPSWLNFAIIRHRKYIFHLLHLSGSWKLGFPLKKYMEPKVYEKGYIPCLVSCIGEAFDSGELSWDRNYCSRSVLHLLGTCRNSGPFSIHYLVAREFWKLDLGWNKWVIPDSNGSAC